MLQLEHKLELLIKYLYVYVNDGIYDKNKYSPFFNYLNNEPIFIKFH